MVKCYVLIQRTVRSNIKIIDQHLLLEQILRINQGFLLGMVLENQDLELQLPCSLLLRTSL